MLLRASTEILARREELGRLLSREEGKTLARGRRGSDPGRPDLRLLRRRGVENSRREVRQRAAERRHRGDARAGRRHRHHCSVEFPHRHPIVEDRARPRLRQRRRLQARRPRARFGARARRDHRARGNPQGRVQPRHGARFGGRPGDPRPQPSRRRDLHRLGRDRPARRGRLRRRNAQVPARDGRQEPARRARRRRSFERGRVRGQRRLFLDRRALHGLFPPHRRGSLSTSGSPMR